MPDDLERLVQRAATDIGTVRWADAKQLRRIARRRTVRSLAVAPVTVLLTVAMVWGLAAQNHDRAPMPPAASSSAPTTSESPSPSASPSSSVPAPSADSWWIPGDAMLQPEDVGPGVVADNELTSVAGEDFAWYFYMDGCPSLAGLHDAYRRHQFMRSVNLTLPVADESGLPIVFAEVRRYSEPDAKLVIGDVQRLVAACPRITGGSEASTPTKPAAGVWTYGITGTGFAGDEALLIKQHSYSIDQATGKVVGNDITTTSAVVRAGGLIVVLSTERDQPDQMKALAGKALRRLCNAGLTRC